MQETALAAHVDKSATKIGFAVEQILLQQIIYEIFYKLRNISQIIYEIFYRIFGCLPAVPNLLVVANAVYDVCAMQGRNVY